MRQVNLDLENCYGIKQLKANFDFSKHSAMAIYAPNGAMKSSLAKTFQDIAENAVSRDRIFPARACKRDVKDEKGADLPANTILVVRPYDEVFGQSEKTSTLLVNAALRQEYEKLHAEIDKAKDALLEALRSQSKSKKDVEKEVSSTFTKSDDQFYIALGRVQPEVMEQKTAPFADVVYDTIFDEKVTGFLGTKDFKTAIEEYIKKYNELLAASTYFKRGMFTYYNASQIAKSLADNGFFKALHTINLNAQEKLEIKDEKELEDLIKKEKENISKDKDLRKKFGEIEKLLQKNVTIRDFQEYLCEHEEILPKLANIEAFKEEIWKSYFVSHRELFRDVLDKHQAAQAKKKEIEEKAAQERTQWEEVIEIFNSRFFVPFRLEAKNRVAVMLGQEPVLTLGFTFEDGADRAPVERKALIEVLSQGERKALYILHVIFEIEVRRKAGLPTLLVIDDIADSFDYKNKYAIIQYLKDNADDANFSQIILTHNFDFFRTINSRFVDYSQCYMASKGAAGLTLSKASGIKNIFVNDWKKHFFDDAKKRIASIPFLRNLIEFTKGDADPDYLKLTSLLHWKADSPSITHSDLDDIYNRLCAEKGSYKDAKKSVIDEIDEQAKACLKAGAVASLEHKVVLSIAIRLTAERFMAKKINDKKFMAAIKASQTGALLSEFKKRFAAESDNIKVVERVILMTPENIHLNSFMYEPILDMSDDHLRKLYEDALALK